MNSFKQKTLLVLFLSGLILPGSFVYADVKGTSENIASVQEKIQTLKEIKKQDNTGLQVVKLKKNILYDLFDLVTNEDEKMADKITESTLTTSTQNIFLENLWDDEEWYLEKRLETTKASSTLALTRITREVKTHRQEIQDILHKQISGAILVNDALRAHQTAKNRLNDVLGDISKIAPENRNPLIESYVPKIQDQLDEASTTIGEASSTFDTFASEEDYKIGIAQISHASELIQSIYDEFLAMSRMAGNSLFNQN